jgi:amino acid adenylation domain-containing protein/non-ribosomal peptide synthase protein (TIGR01720 family)
LIEIHFNLLSMINELSSRNIQNICRLSPMQEGIYFHAAMEEGSDAYFCQNTYRVRKPLQSTLLEKSLQLLVDRHDILRTVFSHKKTEHTVQVVLKNRAAELYFEDISKLTMQDDHLSQYCATDRKRGFDLAKDMLIRLSVFRVSEHEYELVWSHHHIIMDGWCSALLMREFTLVYETLSIDKVPAFAPVAQFSSYINWLQEQDAEQSENFWGNQLEGLEQPSGLQRKSGLPVAVKQFEEVQLFLPEDITARLSQLAIQLHITPNIIYQAAWALVLAQVNNTSDVVFGAVTSVRPAEINGIDSMLGLFINTLPVRVRFRDDETLASLLTSIQRDALGSLPHQFCPLHRIQAVSALKEQLLDHVFIMENFGSAFSDENTQGREAGEISFRETFSQTNYDFNLVLLPGRQAEVRFHYNSAVYHKQYMQGIRNMFDAVLSQIIHEPYRKIGELQLVQEAGANALLALGKGDAQAWDGTILDMFDRQAALHPSAIAVMTGTGESFTYAQLHKKIKSLSQILLASGCSKGSVVGVHTGNSIHTVVSILAVFRTGGIYVPLDENLPAQRISHILRDAGVDIVLIRTGNTLPDDYTGTVLQADTAYDCPCMDDIITRAEAADTAYIIYTSGTTGLPKGVPICHKSIADRIAYHNEYLRISATDKILQFAAVAFDASLVEMFMALTSGACLVLISKECKENVELLKETMVSTGVTIAIFPPAYLKLLQPAELPSLRTIISTGEAAILPDVLAHAKYRTVINGYGPTESCVGASFHKVQPALEPQYRQHNGLPIGKPFSNTQLYILDKQRRLLPQGCIGEICIAGPGLSKGYLNRSELTAEKFVINPYDGRSEYAQVYCTGDLGYWNELGELEYEGRLDQQVQVRGIRVEPGEIERLLVSIPHINEALVLQRVIGHESRLIAYLVMDENATADEEAIRQILSQQLPAYMLPWKCMQLETFPLTVNGKIDRNNLPDPVVVTAAAEHILPSNQQETDLVTALASVMRQDAISMDRHFLELGGDSIKAIQVVSRLYRKGWKLELKEIFQYPLLREMAQRMQPLATMADQGHVKGEVPLGPIQQEFFERAFRYEHHFNQSVLLQSNHRLDTIILQQVISKLMEHHDALRMVYKKENGQVQQFIRELQAPAEVLDIDLRMAPNPVKELGLQAQQVQESFVLAKGPLLKAAIFRLPSGDRLLLAAHHLVVDGVSWRIILEDLGNLYQQARIGAEMKLPPKTESFRTWATQVRQYAVSATEQAWWIEQSSQGNALQFTPTGLPESSAIKKAELSIPHTQALLTAVHRAYRTDMNDLLLSAVSKAFSNVFNQQHSWIVLEGHGRDGIAQADVSRTVGWFTSTYPLALDGTKRSDTGEHIRYIKEQLRGIPCKGAGYGILKYITREQRIVNAPEPQVLFNYLGQVESAETGSDFSLAKEHAGHNVRLDEKILYPLVITAMVLDGQLRLNLRYDVSQVAEPLVASLCTSIKTSLEECIEHCQAQQHALLTPSDLVAPVVNMEQLEKIQEKYQRVCGSPVADLYPLSPMQEGMLFHELLEESSGAYIYQVSYRIKGNVDAALVEQTASLLVKRHDILRTVFHYKETDHLLQVVLSERPVHFKYIKLQNSTLEDFLADGRDVSFDLEKDALFRIDLLELGPNEYAFVWTCHHILMDGWCMGILISEFRELYTALASGRQSPLAQPTPYREYIKWMQQSGPAQALDFWASYLSGYETEIKLQHAAVEKTGARYETGLHAVTINAAQSALLKELSNKCGATTYNVLQAIWGVLLSRYNHSRDVVFGSIVSGRPPEVHGIEQMLGLFINMIPVRVRFTESTLFTNLVRELQQASAEASQYHYCSLAQLQSRTALRAYPLNHFIELENYPVGEAVTQQAKDTDWQVSDVTGKEYTNYDFSLVVSEGLNTKFSFHYNKNVFDDAAIARMAGHFTWLLEQVLADRWINVDALQLNTPADYQQLLDWSTGAKRLYPVEKGYVQLFAEQAAMHAGKIAVSDNHTNWTYEQLWKSALGIASVLKNVHALRPEEVVGICMERSVWTTAAILGTWMAGGAYLPLDTQLPADRIQFMASDAGARLVLVNDEVKAGLENCTIVHVPATSLVNAVNVPVDIHVHSLSYIFYTSGSTGRPKGVMIEQGGMLNHMFAKIEDLQIGEGSVIAQTAAMSFDISVWQLMCPFLAGGSVRVFPHYDVLQAAQMLQAVEQERITHWQVSPVYLSEVLSIAESRKNIPSLSGLAYAIVTGEALKPGLVRRWFAAFPSIPLVNAYGPTEASDDITHAFLHGLPANNVIPIGRPLNNLQVYVSDTGGGLCPPGIPGEILVGGIGVGRGYIGNHEHHYRFSETRFHASARIYRTGDWGMWMDNGQLSFTGRKDDQVKINGQRIELGEIESMLSGAPGIAEAVVLNRPHADQPRIVAYVQWQPAFEGNIVQLKNWMKERLTDSMIPSVFMEIEKFPLTPNGKIDRKNLPDVVQETRVAVDASMPLSTEEKVLAEVWQQVLGYDAISASDDFFESGGDSIRAIQITSRLYSKGYKLEVRDIFEAPRLSELAARLQPLTEAIDQSQVTGQVPLTPVQLHFFEQQLLKPHHYNQSVLLSFRERLAPAMISQLFAHICHHHDALRTRYETNAEGQLVQLITDSFSPDLQYFDWKDQPDFMQPVQDACNSIQSGFSLDKDGLVRIALFSLPDEDCLLIVLHHLVTDGVSWRILLEDLTTLLQQARAGEQLALPLKTNSFRDWSHALQQHAGSRAFAAEKKYWHRLLNKRADALVAPRVGNQAGQKNITIQFDAVQTAQFLKDAHTAFGTDINDLLLAALAYAAKDALGLEEFFIDMERHGREPLQASLNLSRTIGWFTSIFPFHLDAAQADPSRLIKSIKDDVRNIPANGIGYGLMRYTLQDGSLPAVQPQIVFNYLGRFDQEIDDTICKVAPYNAGNNSSPSEKRLHAMNFAAFVTQGALTIKIEYDAALLAEQDMVAFGAAYEHHLDALARYCMQYTGTEKTASDYGYAELSTDDLSMINNLFN